MIKKNLKILLAFICLTLMIFTFSCKYALNGSPDYVEVGIYVSPTGDDATGDGSKENPYLTIQKAVDTASSGDKIGVAAGTYNLPVIMKSGVSIYGGYNSDFSDRNFMANVTTIRPGPADDKIIEINVQSNITIDGFNLSWNAGDGQSGIQVSNSSGITIRNNTIDGGKDGTGSGYGLYITGGGSVTIQNNTVMSGINDNNYGIYATGTNFTINNNTINPGTGINSMGIYAQDCAPSSVINGNTINGGAGTTSSKGIHLFDNSNFSVRGNTINGGTSDNSIGVEVDNCFPIITNNNINAGNNVNCIAINLKANSGGKFFNNVINPGSGDSITGISITSCTPTLPEVLWIYNNTIRDGTPATGASPHQGITFNDTNAEIFNNIISLINGTVSSIVTGGAMFPSVKNNDIHCPVDASGFGYNAGANTGNLINVDPVFAGLYPTNVAVKTSGLDLRGSGVTIDYYGNTRTVPLCMGALEAN